jgi:hypothetical protein
MNRKIFNAPRILIYGGIALALLAAAGWIKAYLSGPDLSTVTVVRHVPQPVEVERVKYLRKVETVKVNVPVEVIREVPAKQAAQLEEKFHFTLPELRAEGRELVDVLAVPKAPHGGEMALIVDTGTGKVAGTFRAKPAPFFELGGIREAGLDYDPVNGAGSAYYRQDLLRIGPAVLNGKAFVSAPLDLGLGRTTQRGPSFGVTIGVAARF